ncbi:MAG: thrombospondin type 3 repeat-containing protein, partial [Anaerolineae bacterium]|nr:thrombospondin type 3 repeat-containing protein [Anaerolineae bacterium]
MSSSHRRKLLLFVPLLVMLAITGTLGIALTSAAPPTPQEKLADIFANARAQSSFHMVADVEQTLIPKSLHSNAGKRDETSAMRVLGDVTKSSAADGSDASRARMMLYAGTEKPVELILADMKAYVGYNGRWQVVEDPLGGAAPGGDTLGYLAAATDIVEAEAMQTAEGTLRRYTFNVDGPTFAEYQRQRMQAALAGQLPQGAEIQASPALQSMSGTGELWVDNDGLPRRQILDLNLPDATDSADARMHMVVDFSRYNDPVAPIRVPTLAGDGGGLVLPDSAAPSTGTAAAGGNGLAALRVQISTALAAAGQALAPVQQPLRQVSLLALVLALGALALIVLGTQRRRRSLYVAVATALTLTMVAQPLLEVGRLIRFDRAAEASPLTEALQDVGAMRGGTVGLNDYIARWQQDLSPRAVDTTDLQDCRSLYSDISPTEDSDGDGLTNETEWCLGTDYSKVDTDGDTITDTVEVEGFVYNNQTWTSDPLNSDSNGDGMNDGDEWKPNLTGEDFVNFNDWDHDGVPNLWDDDNDGDGVPDGNDISPFAVEPYQNQFQLSISGPQAGNALYIDIQMRPITDHLRYSLTTLDWPSDSLGQIKDLDNSTDDMQLIPVLEVQSQISPTLSREYSINVTDSCTSGSNTVNCYSMWVPLQTNESAGKIYGYSARIALTADEAQNVIASAPLLAGGRIRWLTQAALDGTVKVACQSGEPGCTCTNNTCTKDEITTQNSIVASYLEDKVQITGLSITQIQDVEVGLFGTGTNVPQVSTDPNVPDEDKVMMQLMSAGLAGTYLYTTTAITELATNFTNPAPDQPLTTTWGITPSIMHVLTGTYPHRDVALATTNQTTTLQMLNDYYVDCSTTPTQQYTPTLALAYQEISGNKDLLNMTKQDTGAILALTAYLGSDKVPMATMHQTQLTTYACATGGDGQSQWTALPLASPADQPYQSALGELSRRYPSQSTERFFSMVQQLFMMYYFGRSNIVHISGGDGIVVPASEAAFGWLVDYDTNNMPDYVRKVYDLDSLFLAVDTHGTLDGLRDWSGSLATSALSYVGYVAMVRYMIPGLLKMVYKFGRWIVTKVNAWRAPVQPSN